ncbi:MAG: DegT/DnrJ/EryC1/StrS family aminotransferase [Eubacterium sp.]|nr:DegT/DnrJ/EryC1/StrS family aminotransferase [Eubacterium sp.]
MKNEAIYVTRSSMPPYEEYIEAIKPLWESHWLTNMGQYHQELEKRLAEYLMVPEVSLVVNGHMALELAIQSFDFPEGSEVITTPFTFVSTTHAIVRNKLKPVFCDVKCSDGTIDENRIEELITDKTVAILPVHVYGNVCNVERIQEIADKYELKVIYDAAHAFGVEHGNKGIGNYGDVSIFSFHATKVFNTIEGGAVVCKNRDLYEKIYNLKNFGIRGEEEVNYVGANAKMNEFCAIMGLCNLKGIEGAIASRKQVHLMYDEAIGKISGITSLAINFEHRNYAYYPICVGNEYGCDRDELYKRFHDAGIYVRKYFYPLSKDCDCYRNENKEMKTPIAEKLSREVLTLPIYEGMDEECVERVIEVLHRK